MDKAKQAVSDFMSHNNEHKTIVDQDQRAAITEEHVRPQRHEQVTTAIDKEIHQDHHQTILQPIKHTETLYAAHPRMTNMTSTNTSPGLRSTLTMLPLFNTRRSSTTRLRTPGLWSTAMSPSIATAP